MVWWDGAERSRTVRSGGCAAHHGPVPDDRLAVAELLLDLLGGHGAVVQAHPALGDLLNLDGLICWMQNLSAKNKNSLDKIVSISSKIICTPDRNLSCFYNQQVLLKSRSTVSCKIHIFIFRVCFTPFWSAFQVPGLQVWLLNEMKCKLLTGLHFVFVKNFIICVFSESPF